MTSLPRQILHLARYTALAITLFMVAPGCDREDLTSGLKLTDKPVPPPPPTENDVFMNEVVVLNDGSLLDDAGDAPPWLELRNPTSFDIDLGGVELADSVSFFGATRWHFPESAESVIPANGYLLVYLDGRSDELGGLHASIALAPSANTVLLYDASRIFSEDTLALRPGQSIGVPPGADPGTFAPLVEATPLAPNAEIDTSITPAEAPFIRGDVDESGAVGFPDTVLLNRIVHGEEPRPACADRADVDDDGDIDADDFQRLVTAVFDASVPIPPPFPAAGLDPTPDALSCPLE